MGWERRGNQSYFYRSRRSGGRVVKEYVGAGRLAKLAAAEIGNRRQDREEARIRHRRMRHELLALESLASTGQVEFTQRAERVLDRAGFHFHRGEWRRRRARRYPKRPTTRSGTAEFETLPRVSASDRTCRTE